MAARLVTNLGFPCFVALVLLFQVIHMHRENHQMIEELKGEIAKMRAAVERLTDLLLHSSELKLRIRD